METTNLNEKRILIIFDFDCSLIPSDSDSLIINSLAPEYSEISQKMYSDNNSIYKKQWSKIIDLILIEIMLNKNIKLNQIKNILETMPIDYNTLLAIKYASRNNGILTIISDANQYYIETILKYYEIYNLFTKITTNYSYIIQDNNHERLQILPYQPDDQPHNCPNCPLNLCKGSVVDRYKVDLLPSNVSSFSHIIYIGDGNGDYCGVKHLRSEDIILCRKDWALHQRIRSDPSILASIIPWEDGQTIYDTFQQVFQSSSDSNNNKKDNDDHNSDNNNDDNKDNNNDHK